LLFVLVVVAPRYCTWASTALAMHAIDWTLCVASVIARAVLEVAAAAAGRHRRRRGPAHTATGDGAPRGSGKATTTGIAETASILLSA